MESGKREKGKKNKGWLKAAGGYIGLCLETFLLLLGQLIGILLELLPPLGNKDVWDTFVPYVEFIGIWITTILFLVLSRKNRPILLFLGKKSRGNRFSLFVFGLLSGSVMNGLCALLAFLHGDITLIFNSFNVIYFILLFAAVFIQSGAEELLCRCFLLQKLRERFSSPLAAVIGNAVFFASLHLANDGVTFYGFLSDLFIGLVFSFIVYYLESIWCAMAMHTAWNFMQNIVLGLPNSGDNCALFYLQT